MFQAVRRPSFEASRSLPARLLQQAGGFLFLLFYDILGPDSWTLSFVPFPPARCDALGAFSFAHIMLYYNQILTGGTA